MPAGRRGLRVSPHGPEVRHETEPRLTAESSHACNQGMHSAANSWAVARRIGSKELRDYTGGRRAGAQHTITTSESPAAGAANAAEPAAGAKRKSEAALNRNAAARLSLFSSFQKKTPAPSPPPGNQDPFRLGAFRQVAAYSRLAQEDPDDEHFEYF